VIFHKDEKEKPAYEAVVLRGGVVGYQLPDLKAEVIPISPGDLLLAATDGIYSGFTAGININDPPSRIAEKIMKQHFKGNDDALVMAVRYLGGKDEGQT